MTCQLLPGPLSYITATENQIVGQIPHNCNERYIHFYFLEPVAETKDDFKFVLDRIRLLISVSCWI